MMPPSVRRTLMNFLTKIITVKILKTIIILSLLSSVTKSIGYPSPHPSYENSINYEMKHSQVGRIGTGGFRQ